MKRVGKDVDEWGSASYQCLNRKCTRYRIAYPSNPDTPWTKLGIITAGMEHDQRGEDKDS